MKLCERLAKSVKNNLGVYISNNNTNLFDSSSNIRSAYNKRHTKTFRVNNADNNLSNTYLCILGAEKKKANELMSERVLNAFLKQF